MEAIEEIVALEVDLAEALMVEVPEVLTDQRSFLRLFVTSVVETVKFHLDQQVPDLYYVVTVLRLRMDQDHNVQLAQTTTQE